MFLDAAALLQLTGLSKPSAQIRYLEREGIAHLVNAAGRPVVTWAAVEARLGLRPESPAPAKIDFSALHRA